MAFKKLSKEWCCIRDFYELLQKSYEGPSKEDSQNDYYTDLIHEVNAFGKKYGVESVLKQPQKEPCAALAFRLSCAVVDLAEDLRKVREL